MGISNTALCAILVLCFALVLKAWRNHIVRHGLPLPPGPKGLPLIGNIFDIDVSSPWKSYQEMGRRYGDLVYCNLLGNHFVIINSEKLAQELLDRRSHIYSDRPYISTNELFGMDFNTGLLSYGSTWRLHRKLFRIALGKDVTPTYMPMQLQKVHQFLQNLLDSPQDYANHVTTLSSAIIMSVTYGYDIAPQNDPFVSKAVKFIRLFIEILTPERAVLLGAIPFLARIPSWCPGGRFKQRAGECRGLARDMLDGPVAYVKDSIAAGTAPRSLVRDLYQEDGAGPCDEDTVKAVATTVFLGGAETTHGTILVFLLAMLLYPHVQVKAQEEIDQVIGNGRLPDFGDREYLPYVEAICLETLRWHPVAPLNLPHMTSTYDIYESTFIPKGTTVLINAWAMAQDETRYPEPDVFKPERHLNSDGSLAEGTSLSMFGFGRRICPGQYLANQTLWVTMVSVLATMRIDKAKDRLGNPIEVIPEFTSGLSTYPLAFPCSIVPRSLDAEQLIRASNCSN